MERANPDAPRLTPEEAEARAAALIAKYRDESRGPARSRGASRSSFLTASVGWVVVYLAGVIGCAMSRGRPMIAVLLGVPLVLIAHAVLGRRGAGAKSEPR